MIACVSAGFSKVGAELTMRYAFGFGIIDVNHKFKLLIVQTEKQAFPRAYIL